MSASAEKTFVSPIPGYRVHAVLHQSNRVTVYRAVRELDRRAVILKVLNPAFQGTENLSLLARERDITRGLADKGAIGVCDDDAAASAGAIVFEDFGGESLKTLAAWQPFSLAECLALGVKIAEALASIHAARVIHKDLSPANVVYNPKTGDLKIIDFGSATSLAREQPSPRTPGALEGTLTYMSPEQTGRMNRSVDYRSDFYSLGALLYELLTGRPPFDESDPLSLVHAHLAKEPLPPSAVDRDIPTQVDAIVLKLLAKTAEERYQSALGIQRDLEECARQLKETAAVAPFPLGRFDASTSLRLSQRLYGRETEIQTLLGAYDRAANGGREIAMVTGYSGIGKTSLVRELYKPITARRGYFITGKFDQLQRNVPYKAIINAFQELTRQLLGENEAQLSAWKEKLSAALGNNGRIIIDIIPEIELIIGAQPPPIALDPRQEQNRFNLAFSSFIRVFCGREHPLTIYLDDLQWIDPASLKLLTHLVGDPSLKHFFFVGAYRDNEVNAAHPLIEALQDLQKRKTVVHTLTLEALRPEHVQQLVADTLSMDSPRVASLADLIVRKTAGNPFFTEEFIKSLYADGLLSFDRAQGVWRWDVRDIESKASTDNVIELMVLKLKRLNAETQRVLQLAACIGNQFDLGTLAVIYQKTIPETMAALHEAIEDEMVIPIGTSLSWSGSPAAGAEVRLVSRFAHDRIQHAAYSLIPEAQRQAAHLEIGRRLLRELSEENRREQLFEIANHFNIALALVAESAEQETLIELNFSAGRRARHSNAYDAALSYFRAALILLGESAWESNYPRALAVHTEAARAALLAGKFSDVDRLVDRVLARAKRLLDKIDAYEVKIESLITQGQMPEAAGLGFRVLAMLGVSFPERCDRRRFKLAHWRLKLALWGKSTEELLNAPLMRDPVRLAEMQIIPHVLTASYWAMPAHSGLLAMRAVQVSARYGNTSFSAFAYASYGTVLCTAIENVTEGRKFGELALALVDRLNAVGLKAKVWGPVHGMVFHWTAHLRSTAEPLAEAVRDGLEAGDIEWASHAAASHVIALLYSAPTLGEVDAHTKKYGAVAKGTTRESNFIRRQWALNLMGGSDDPCELSGESWNEAELPRALERRLPPSLLAYYAAKISLAYLFDRPDTALRNVDAIRKWLKSGVGLGMVAPHFFMEALVRLALYDRQNPLERAETLEAVDGIQRRLRRWAAHAPMNHLHRVHLVAAERCRVRELHAEAGELYDMAIAEAKEYGYLLEEALGNELAGKFCLARKRIQLAHLYLREARDVYARWGAQAKVKQLEQKYGFLAEEQSRSNAASGAEIDAAVSTDSSSMDLQALMQGLKEIGSEQIHSNLLEKIITLAMEVAGAQSALLFLRNDRGELSLEAQAGATRSRRAEILQAAPLASCPNVSRAIVNYVCRTQQTVVIHDAQSPQSVIPGLDQEPYVRSRGVKSIFCIPLLSGSLDERELSGVLYLEHNGATHTFIERVREPLEIICLSAAGRLELSRKAVTDLLTRVYNHDYMQGILQKEVSAAKRNGGNVSLIMIDIDHFKKFNDLHGHQAGDVVLTTVAQLIKASTRQSDIVARYGGEELAVVLPDTELRTAVEVAERIRRTIEETIVSFEEKELNVTVSMGVASNGPQTNDPKSLVRAADAALYESKHAGRNRVTANRAA